MHTHTLIHYTYCANTHYACTRVHTHATRDTYEKLIEREGEREKERERDGSGRQSSG